MPETTQERIVRIISATQHLTPEQTAAITDGSTFQQLGIDSLDGINIVFALEEEFNIAIPDEAAKSIAGVHDLVVGIEKLLAAKSPAAEPD